jgi:hypothetical protein
MWGDTPEDLVEPQERTVTFAVLHTTGELTDVREIPVSAIKRCWHLIMSPSHYRDDNTCRCDDKSNVTMRTWGYRWNARRGRWM